MSEYTKKAQAGNETQSILVSEYTKKAQAGNTTQTIHPPLIQKTRHRFFKLCFTITSSI